MSDRSIAEAGRVMNSLLVLYAGGVAASAAALRLAQSRLQLSRAKHRSIRGHARLSRRLARLVPFYEYRGDRFFRSDGASADVADRRRHGFERLARVLQERSPRTIQLTEELESGISDLQFTQAYRVPFQYRRHVSERLRLGTLVHESSGVLVT